MEEKRLSLRFRTENPGDMKAWKLLEEMARTKNTSKNAIVIELILSALEQENSKDVLAEQIAELVVTKLGGAIVQREARRESATGIVEDDSTDAVEDSQADEPVVLGEDALDFLDMFG